MSKDRGRAGVNGPGGPADAAGQPRGVESARRALSLFACFSKERHTLTARELARLTGIPLPTVFRYVAFLRDAQWLIGDEQGGYRLSMRFLPLAEAARAADNLALVADPVMRRLSAETGETVILVRLLGRSAVCVHRIESSQRLRTSYEPGQPLPLEHGASARVLLASLPAEARADYLAPLRARDPAAVARTEAELAVIGERGWACSEEEIDKGIWAVAVAVRDRTGITAALSVPSPLVRAPAEMQETLRRQVMAAAEEISGTLCGADA